MTSGGTCERRKGTVGVCGRRRTRAAAETSPLRLPVHVSPCPPSRLLLVIIRTALGHRSDAPLASFAPSLNPWPPWPPSLNPCHPWPHPSILVILRRHRSILVILRPILQSLSSLAPSFNPCHPSPHPSILVILGPILQSLSSLAPSFNPCHPWPHPSILVILRAAEDLLFALALAFDKRSGGGWRQCTVERATTKATTEADPPLREG